MKRENNKWGNYRFFSLLIAHCSLFIVHCSLFFVLGCHNPFNPPKPGKTASGGTGSFSLAIGGVHAGRTILPATVQNDFALYTLEFFLNGSNITPALTVERTNANLSNPVHIDAGTWDLHVTAYMDIEKNKPAVQGMLTDIVIASGASVSRSLTLMAIIDEGEGLFRWKIDYPAGVVRASMTIMPFDEKSGTAEQTLYFIGGTPLVGKTSSLSLNTGYYRVVFELLNSSRSVERSEIMHVYKNLESVFEYTFTAGHFTYLIVTNSADSGTESLRQAITDAPANSTIIVDNSIETIALNSRITIARTLNIEGNGVTITRNSSWTTENADSQLLFLNTASAEVKISRIHFKGGRATSNGAAIRIGAGTMTLESCIFSGNRTTSTSAYGGAMYNGGNLTVSGCTFYGNSTGVTSTSSSYGGGAIYTTGANSTVTVTGNLFYGNTGNNPIIRCASGTVCSGGYNAVDVPFGTSTGNYSGWAAENSDKQISNMPVSPVSFRLLSGREAANVITSLPVAYPATDFYGNATTNNAAAGAVQSVAGGYYLDIPINERGSVSVTPAPNEDGLYAGLVTLTAVAGEGTLEYKIYWLVEGEREDDNPLTITVNAHTKVQTVFELQITGVTLVDKLIFLKANIQNDGSYIVEVGADETVAPQTLSYSGVSGVTITLRNSGGMMRTVSLGSNGALFTVGSGVTLVLENNITLRGRSSNSNSVVRVNAGGAFVMEGGTVSGNSSDGGVYVTGSGSSFAMQSGIISNNTASSGSSNYGGGVHVTSGGTFTMSGTAEISGNTASGNGGGGVYVGGSGTFAMQGGTISGNNASGGSINNGGGVYVGSSGTFAMSGGSLTGNTARGGYGGGVYVDSGNFTKAGSASIIGFDDDAVNGNAVKDGSDNAVSNRGHAVYALRASVFARRETSIGSGENISFSGSADPATWEGAWDETN